MSKNLKYLLTMMLCFSIFVGGMGSTDASLFGKILIVGGVASATAIIMMIGDE